MTYVSQFSCNIILWHKICLSCILIHCYRHLVGNDILIFVKLVFIHLLHSWLWCIGWCCQYKNIYTVIFERKTFCINNIIYSNMTGIILVYLVVNFQCMEENGTSSQCDQTVNLYYANITNPLSFQTSFRKVDQHTGGKWVMTPNTARTISCKAWNCPVKYHSRESKLDIKE